MGYLDITSEGPVDDDPVRRARQDEGDEVMGVLRVGLSRSTVPRAAFSERQGGLCHGGIRDQDHDIDHMVPLFPSFGLKQGNLGKAHDKGPSCHHIFPKGIAAFVHLLHCVCLLCALVYW